MNAALIALTYVVEALGFIGIALGFMLLVITAGGDR